MKNTLLMRTEASYSFNFLVYIQNIYLNQNNSGDKVKFPFMPTKYEFRKDFEICYRRLWEGISMRISENPLNDLVFFIEKKALFYQHLFVENNDTLNDFNEIYDSFKVWWNSFAGRFSIEKSIDAYEQNMYAELANTLMEKRMTPKKELNISLIYDECLLLDLEPSSYFAVLSIRDCILKNKEFIAKLQVSIN
ncbi:hypothetical protein [Bacillus sp. 1P06AnD]|uniref:hypothetical protein n=1 Tax=Bacillus sp. 1P06AnD TaxID=3132208 RepID=UPI0039A1E568